MSDAKARTPSLEEWMEPLDFESTEDVPVPELLVDQVIGQEEAVDVIKKAAEQRRHAMLIGDPGTGKSMLARAMTELLPGRELQDILAYHNPDDSNCPRIRVVPAGKGKEIVQVRKREAERIKEQKSSMITMVMFFVISIAILGAIFTGRFEYIFYGIIAAVFILLASRMWLTQKKESIMVPKLLVSHEPGAQPPFVDATGAHAGSLLGDVKHDPFQSGGLETPAHDRVEAGAIHKANKGVLFIDEINTLHMESQQSLLTGLQEKEYSIMGQSERSSGAMVKSEPVPCDFILVAAGNLDSIYGVKDQYGITHGGMHPALRSRIRGYGYEVYVNSTMPDTLENREKLVRFVAQEVIKDEKIPHFSRGAVLEVLREAQRRAGRRGHLTLRLRELGGLIRAAGDVAREEKKAIVSADQVIRAKRLARSLEQQVADKYIERKKEYKDFFTTGAAVGMVNGLGVLGGESNMNEFSGVITPIVAEVTPASSRNEGRIIATGQLGKIAKEAVQNVSAVIKKYTGRDISNYDVHIQFVGTHEGIEGDSASISIATSVFSALENIPVNQGIAMTGSLSVRGKVLPVGGVTAKIEGAAESGIKKVLIPLANQGDVQLENKYRNKVQVIPVETFRDVLHHALVGAKKASIVSKLSKMVADNRPRPLKKKSKPSAGTGKKTPAAPASPAVSPSPLPSRPQKAMDG